MKKIIIFLLLALLSSNVSAMEHWRAEDTYYKFNFDKSEIPEYTVHSGKWEIGNPGNAQKVFYDFESEPLDVKKGIWKADGGALFQEEEGMSSTTRALAEGIYEDFSLSFDVIPASLENTMMIYFGYQNEAGFNSIEINSYQSKLILNGEETVGTGSIIKDKKYRINFVINRGQISLYCNSELIFEKEVDEKIVGQVGIGTWNSKMQFDNLEIGTIPLLGENDKLIGSSKEQGILIFDEIYADNFLVSVKLASEQIEEMGIILRANDNSDGYYAVADKTSVYIAKQKYGKKEILKRAEYKMRSDKFYEFSCICDGNEITFYIDSEPVVSAVDNEFEDGNIGLYFDDTKVYCENVTVSRLKEVLPPVISQGNTEYYVDSENGNNKNDGRSPESAWKTIDRISQTEFLAGDKILFKRGCKFEGTLHLENVQGDILVSSYGDGALPQIISVEKVINIENSDNVRISELNLSLRHFGKDNNLWAGTGYGITLKNSKNAELLDIVLEGSGIDTDSLSISFGDKESYDTCNIQNTESRNFGFNGIAVNGERTKSLNRKINLPDIIKRVITEFMGGVR